MLIPTGTVHKATATASTIKEVQCYNCRAKYFYILTRTGRGRETAPFFIGQQRAETAAQTAAVGELAYYLAAGVDPVACPGCGHFQPDMITAAKDRRMSLRKLIGLSALAFILPMVPMFLFLTEKQQDAYGVFLYAIGFGTFFLLAAIRIRTNPNTGASARIGLAGPGPARFLTLTDAERALANSAA